MSGKDWIFQNSNSFFRNVNLKIMFLKSGLWKLVLYKIKDILPLLKTIRVKELLKITFSLFGLYSGQSFESKSKRRLVLFIWNLFCWNSGRAWFFEGCLHLYIIYKVNFLCVSPKKMRKWHKRDWNIDFFPILCLGSNVEYYTLNLLTLDYLQKKGYWNSFY